MMRTLFLICGRIFPLVTVALLFALLRPGASDKRPEPQPPTVSVPLEVNMDPPPESVPTPAPPETPAPAAEAAQGDGGEATGFKLGLAIRPEDTVRWGCVPLTFRDGKLLDPQGGPFEGARTFRLQGAIYGIPAELNRRLVALLKPHLPADGVYRVDVRLGADRTVTLLRVYAKDGSSTPNKVIAN